MGMLMMMPEVRDELGLLDDQVADLRELGDELRDRFREEMRGMRDLMRDPDTRAEAFARMEELRGEAEERLGEVLTTEQLGRLRQIGLQQQMRGGGARAILSPQVAEKLGITDEQRELKETARKFARAELPELAREIEEKDIAVPADMLRTYGEMGFLGVNLPEEYGGLGLGHLEALIVLEEFAQISNAVAFPVFEALTGPVRTIDRFGSDAMKAKVLPEVIRGEKIVAVSMSEPDAGTALTDLKTSAKASGSHPVCGRSFSWPT